MQAHKGSRRRITPLLVGAFTLSGVVIGGAAWAQDTTPVATPNPATASPVEFLVLAKALHALTARSLSAETEFRATYGKQVVEGQSQFIAQRPGKIRATVSLSVNGGKRQQAQFIADGKQALFFRADLHQYSLSPLEDGPAPGSIQTLPDVYALLFLSWVASSYVASTNAYNADAKRAEISRYVMLTETHETVDGIADTPVFTFSLPATGDPQSPPPFPVTKITGILDSTRTRLMRLEADGVLNNTPVHLSVRIRKQTEEPRLSPTAFQIKPPAGAKKVKTPQFDFTNITF